MSAVTCPQCQHGVFEVHVMTFGVDFDVDVTDEPAFLIDRAVMEEPDSVEIEAICRNCGHARYVPAGQWEWA